MADENGKEKPPSLGNTSGPARRQRAPTITIDTSQGDVSEERDNPAALLGEPNAPDLRTSYSFDRQRPISPHNILSPSSKWADSSSNNFLSVPHSRSRGNSVDSEDVVKTPLSGNETSNTSLASIADDKSAHSNNDDIINDTEALRPDPGHEDEFFVQGANKFAFTPGHLGKLFDPKSLSAFHALGGLKGLERGLRTSLESGLSVTERELDGTISFDDAVRAKSGDDSAAVKPGLMRRSTSSASKPSDKYYADRRRLFNSNRLPEKKPKNILQLAWIAYNDKVLILLTVAAAISLALGIYQSLRPKHGEAPIEWVEGVAIIVAIVIVVIVGAANDWQKERQFVKLNRKKEDRVVKVIRSGRSMEISVFDLLVGDVMHIEAGDMIPVDGIYIAGHNIKCDESSATGESDLLRKTPGDDAFKAIHNHQSLRKIDPFIISGGKVSEGVGTFLVTGVGVHSSYGRTMMSLHEDPQVTPLQSKLNVLAEYIAKIGLAAGLLLFTATFIKFIVDITTHAKGSSPDEKGQQFLQVFIVAVTIIVVAVPEGLPLAVTLALAFATTRMLKDNNLVRLLRACETMGNATTVCSDKTGTLTQNKMSVVAGILGATLRFGDKPILEDSPSSSPDTPAKQKISNIDLPTEDKTITNFKDSLSEEVKVILRQSIAVNSTAFESEESDGKTEFIGSKTETALLTFARDHLTMKSLDALRGQYEIVQLIPFDSSRKCMGAVIKLQGSKYRLVIKGASEILLARCARIIKDPSQGISDTIITTDDMDGLTGMIEAYATRSLRTIAMIYRDYESWPPRGAPTMEDDPKMAVFEKIFKEMTLLAIVGIQDPLREGVAGSVRACQKAGVFVRMVTGDNVITAKSIAQECGIFTPGGLVMEGPSFRKLNRKQMSQIVPRLQVLARSSPDDKRILVKHLRDAGETVAVTGDGTNDAPALKAADVGFSMGIAGTEVAKEASAIILMDDNFASIVKAIMWGRAVNDAVKKFLQFQLTVNITAVILTFVSAVASTDESPVLTAVQLLWVNLIMDTLAALALATDPPTKSILDRPPEPKSAPLISFTMWKMTIGQSIFQLVITLILNFGGSLIFDYASDEEKDSLKTAIFNTFVWMQIFNQYNSRRLDNKLNIFEGILKNWWFIGVQFVIVGGQVLIVFVGGAAFAIHPIDGYQWGYSVILGLFSLPVAVIIRMIPNDWVRKLIPSWLARRAKPKLMITDEEHQFEWNPALEEIREELTFLKRLRGGRLTVLKYKLQHPRDYLLPSSRSGTSSRSHSRTSSLPRTPTIEASGSDSLSFQAPPTPDSRRSNKPPRITRSRSNTAFGPAAAMAGIVAGSIGGWSPVGRREDDGDAPPDFGDESWLEQQKGLELHPRSSEQDSVVIANPTQSPPSQHSENDARAD